MTIQTKIIKVEIELMEEMLGMSASPDIHEKYIASRAPDAAKTAEEVEALGVETVLENKRTIFPKENGIPFLWDYQIKGMFKDSCGMLRRVSGSLSSQMPSYKKIIDGQIFVSPRKIFLQLPTGQKTGTPELLGNCQRPLRAETPQGPRIALADSETVPAGTTFRFEITLLQLLKKESKTKKSSAAIELSDYVMEWLDYGMLRGMGQWRNSGKGRFKYMFVGEME